MQGAAAATPVRLEIEADAPPDIGAVPDRRRSTSTADDVYPIPGLLDLTGLFQIYGLPGYADLRDPPFVPAPVPEFAQSASPWAAIRGRDILVHHPYESFAPRRRFHRGRRRPTTACWPSSRRSTAPVSDSPIVRALQRAADNGKQVTAVIELKARLDEERNILWAQELEKAGVHVVFGFVGLKTHCKVALVVRRDEDDGIRRYVHLATGNYNPQTARIYTDLGFFTCNPDFGDDASALFNYLTGYGELPQWRKLVVAPSRLQTFMIEKIDREAANQRPGKPARHHRQDQRPAGAGGRAGAVPGQPGGREDRPRLPRHLLAAAGHAGRQREHPRHLDRRSLPGAQPHLLLRATAATRRCTSARPTGWTAT